MNQSLISHLGIAVKDLDEAVKKYILLTGDDDPSIHDVPDQKIKAAIFKGSFLGNGSRIELISPTSDDSPISKFLDKKGEGLHHVSIFVEDIEAKLTSLKDAGIKLIDENPRIGAEGNKIAFIHPKDTNGVLIELEEIPKP